MFNIADEHVVYTLFKIFSTLHRSSQISLSRRMKEERCEKVHPPILMSIYIKEGLSQNELAKLLHFNKGAIAKIVKNMEAAGYIKRTADEKDKRIHRLYLTSLGKDTIKKLISIEREWSMQISDAFSQEEMTDLISYLNRIINILRKEEK